MPPPVRRPLVSPRMWPALKSHIMRARKQKRMERAAAEAFERWRQEQELMRMQDDRTLEDIRDEIRLLEQLIQELKQEEQQLLMLQNLRMQVEPEDDPRHRVIGRDVDQAHAA
ncbi:hypothetical protein MTO96_018534 [Rhipicephalus appendiculatus]